MLLEQMITVPSQLQQEAGIDQMIAHSDLRSKYNLFLLRCEDDGLSSVTIDDYRKMLRLFLQFMESQGINAAQDVTELHIRSFLSKKRETCNSISVHGYYRHVRRFFSWLVEDDWLKTSPMAKIRPPRMERKIIHPLSDEDIRKLLALCDSHTLLGARNRAIILMFYDTGLRLREMASIQLQDIDPERSVIKVMGKGARERFVRYGARTRYALACYMELRRLVSDNHPCLWVSEERRPLKRWGIEIVIQKLGKRAGLIKCHPHLLRHSSGTSALRNGADMREVQILLGHSTLNTTLRYLATINSEYAIEGHKGNKDRPGFSPVDRMGLR